MEKVRWHDDERVDGPDMRAVLDLVEAHMRRILAPLLGAEAESNVDGGVLWGLQYAPGAAPNEQQQSTFGVGMFVDSLRKVFEVTNPVVVDISPVSGQDDSEVWARVNPTQTESATDDRVMIVGGAETTLPKTTRITDSLEIQVLLENAGPPAGSGWVQIATFTGWSVGPPALPTVQMHYPFGGDKDAANFARSVREVIRIIKGGAGPDNWKDAPATTLDVVAAAIAKIPAGVSTVYGARAAACFIDDGFGDVSEVSKTGTTSRNVDFVHADTSKISTGQYKFKLSTAVPTSEITGHVSITKLGNNDATGERKARFYWELDVAGGNVTHVQIWAFNDDGTGYQDMTDAGISWALF